MKKNILRKHNFLVELTILKVRTWLQEEVKISEVSEFSILSYTQNRKLGNLGKCSFTSNFDSCCNLRFRNNKNELRQKLKSQDMLLEEKKISEISEFSTLPYT